MSSSRLTSVFILCSTGATVHQSPVHTRSPSFKLRLSPIHTNCGEDKAFLPPPKKKQETLRNFFNDLELGFISTAKLESC